MIQLRNGARYYEPTSGRFLSADPMGQAASPSLYDYAGGDPINTFDPDGRCPQNQSQNGWGQNVHDPNSSVASYGAMGADCAVVAVQNIQKAFGVPIDSKETIINNFGLPASNFEPGGRGLTGSPEAVAGYLNQALNPSGLAVDQVTVNSVQEFTTVVNSYTAIALGTEVYDPDQIQPVGHLTVAVNTHTSDQVSLTIYNPSGSGGSVTYTPQQAMAKQIPTNYNGASGKIWVVYIND